MLVGTSVVCSEKPKMSGEVATLANGQFSNPWSRAATFKWTRIANLWKCVESVMKAKPVNRAEATIEERLPEGGYRDLYPDLLKGYLHGNCDPMDDDGMSTLPSGPGMGYDIVWDYIDARISG